MPPLDRTLWNDPKSYLLIFAFIFSCATSVKKYRTPTDKDTFENEYISLHDTTLTMKTAHKDNPPVLPNSEYHKLAIISLSNSSSIEGAGIEIAEEIERGTLTQPEKSYNLTNETQLSAILLEIKTNISDQFKHDAIKTPKLKPINKTDTEKLNKKPYGVNAPDWEDTILGHVVGALILWINQLSGQLDD